MRKTFTLKNVAIAAGLTIIAFNPGNASGQCATSAAPVYTKTCSVEYYQDISASGIGVTSTIAVAGITSCSTTYIDDHTSQGITAVAGSTVTVSIARPTGYTAYLTIYTDWNNNGTFDLTEICGTQVTIPSTSSTATYTFTIPTTGFTVGTSLPMRFFLSESVTGDPCNGTYGQTYDFYCNVTCPPVPISISPITDSVCIGGSGDTLTASGAGVGGTYTWTPPTGLSAVTGDTVVATPVTATTYTVTGTTSIGCTGSATEIITLRSGPTAPTDTALGLTKFCSGDSVMLEDTIKLAGYTYQWYNGATKIAGATDTSYTAKISGSYSIGIVDPISGCTSLGKTIVVTVHPLPNPAIIFDGKYFHTSKYYTTFKWYENGTLISGATYDSVKALTNGNYQVKVVDTNGCQDTSITYTLKHLGISNIINNSTIRIYPNPANSIVHIESADKVNAVVSDMAGRIVTEQKDAHEISISHLANGIFIVELFDDTGHRVLIQKLIKN